jgi:hypothetical protein
MASVWSLIDTGDGVHEAVSERWPRQSRIDGADFLLDVFNLSGPTRAGLVHPE